MYYYVFYILKFTKSGIILITKLSKRGLIMEIDLSQLPISQLFKDYKHRIESKSNRKISLLLETNEIVNYPAAFYHSNDNCILVRVNPGLEKDMSIFEPIIAHEITHGYLKYKCKYGFIKMNPENIQLAAKIQTMIEDIPVQKMIADYGFIAIPPPIEASINIQLCMIKSGMPVGLIYDTWSLVHNIVLYWGHIKYIKITEKQRIILKELLDELQKRCPNEYMIGEEISNMFNEYDVFQAEGYSKIMLKIITKWNFPFHYIVE
ncbi:hypothetical protein SPACI_002010 [Sporomusa acidovorans DSM 3132]|uniref:Peptidase M48 domain-containing protein n=2 Tax=Sporomusa TaxID=2375 RepID=A0ABZ3IWG3_SPOA4|nr:hypothetical protein SPACI_16360 [Sporomusa acidovorans DSM 3132]SDF70242.1 hypothetical protein SAMN04488499_106917 [Sporomusa acidovorans]